MKILFAITIGILIMTTESVAQIYGCTDKLAFNYNSKANQNDGSCLYTETTIKPSVSLNLPSAVKETSGIIIWNHHLWTLNDTKDKNLYALDSIKGAIANTISLNKLMNYDWEEISQDQKYVYIGEFGNNANGNSKNLMIFRINKQSIQDNIPTIDVIHFSYSNQTDFTPRGTSNTDFDCEAFIVTTDSIFLFTKQWISNKTSIYSLPKIPGTYIAHLKATYDVKGLITGATYLASKKIIALSGYSNLLQPFIFLLYDFNGTDYFGGNKRKVMIDLPFHQVEGIATNDGIHFYISNERFIKLPFFSTAQQLHLLDLGSLTRNHLNK